MGACVSSHSHPSHSASFPGSSLQSPTPRSPDVLCHGLETRTASSSHSSSGRGADAGLLTGNTRSSLSTDLEQLHAVYEQQQHDSQCPPSQQHKGNLHIASYTQLQQPLSHTALASDDSSSRSASPDDDKANLPPPQPAPVAVYRFRDDDDDDSEGEEEEEDGKIDELELITEEQVFSAASDSFDDDPSLNTAPMTARRISLLASAPPGASISSSLSSLDSPYSMERRLTVTVSVGSFHVLLVDEDERHAELIARWLRKKQFVVTVCADGEEAVSLMQEIYEVSRARNSYMASSHSFSHSQPLDSTDELRLSVSSSAIDTSMLHDIDLIISDTCMTGTDGQPLLDFCKLSPAFAHIPIVLMSVDVESAAVNRSINRGAYDHWPKPLARPLLQNTVRVIREGKKEERKASLLREWGDKYKLCMLEERKAAIGQGHQPHSLSATPLTALRSAMLLTPLAPSSRSLPPINGATGGWSAAASYGHLMAHEGRTFAVVLNTLEEEQLEHERLREWLRELCVEHSMVSSVADVSKRVERMVRSSDRVAPKKKRGKSWQANSFQIPLPVARIQEEREAEPAGDSSGGDNARRREEANKEKVKGIIGLMKQHSRSKTSGGSDEQYVNRDVDLLIVDMDGLDEEALAGCHSMLEKATDKAVSIIVMSDSSSTLALPSHADIDAVLQKPVRKETFCTKVSAIIARRQARLHSNVLAQRAEGYKEMVDKIRQKRASQMTLNNGSASNNTSPPSKTVSVGTGTGTNGRYHIEATEVAGRRRSDSQPDERQRGEKMLLPLERTPSLPLVKLRDEEQKEASDEVSYMLMSVYPPAVTVKQTLQPLSSRAASAHDRLQQLDASGAPVVRRALSVNKPLEHGSLRAPRDEEAGRRLSST